VGIAIGMFWMSCEEFSVEISGKATLRKGPRTDLLRSKKLISLVNDPFFPSEGIRGARGVPPALEVGVPGGGAISTGNPCKIFATL
jgi:hypothetical protein